MYPMPQGTTVLLCVAFLAVPAWIYAGLKRSYNHRFRGRNTAEPAFISVVQEIFWQAV